ncbi:MAG: hypothetical protein M5U17_10475 [Ignavibacterium sp.]|nr:hypothetical protein [Ignavibacterium sp.]
MPNTKDKNAKNIAIQTSVLMLWYRINLNWKRNIIGNQTITYKDMWLKNLPNKYFPRKMDSIVISDDIKIIIYKS